jgi:serine/threonine-protein kinase HipA
MRTAKVYVHDQFAGLLSEDDQGYTFEYDADYLENGLAQAVSLTLPITTRRYQSNVMFAFFDGLIPEGWLLKVAQKNWKLNERDRMGLLMVCCRDCIGAVSIIGDEV